MGMMTMRIEIEFAVKKLDIKEFERFMEALTHFTHHWEPLIKELRIVREENVGDKKVQEVRK